jgi:rod shape-determining protein MreC
MNKTIRHTALLLPTFLRPLAPYLPTLALVAAALLLIIMNVFFPALTMRARVFLTDAFSPVFHLMSKPADALRDADMSWGDWTGMREENRTLREENAKLKALIPLAQQYEAENKTLRAHTQFKDDSVLSFLSARVIAHGGGAFVNSAVVTAGGRDGVKKDMIALNEDGVIGRVIEVGEWSSRILLLQDLSFRLPVQIDAAQTKAILSGDGDAPLKLLFVPRDIELKKGLRVVTSGHGGIFPPFLPVGMVDGIKDGVVTIKPFADINRLNIVRLARYDLAGGKQNPVNQTGDVTHAPRAR